MAVKELEHQILSLTLAEKAQILQLLLRDFPTAWAESARPADGAGKASEQNGIPGFAPENLLSPDEFDLLADQLVDEFAVMVDVTSPALSDYAMSRASIYEDHD